MELEHKELSEDDIISLLVYHLSELEIRHLTYNVLDFLTWYDWPGGVSELEACAARLADLTLNEMATFNGLISAKIVVPLKGGSVFSKAEELSSQIAQIVKDRGDFERSDSEWSLPDDWAERVDANRAALHQAMINKYRPTTSLGLIILKELYQPDENPSWHTPFDDTGLKNMVLDIADSEIVQYLRHVQWTP